MTDLEKLEAKYLAMKGEKAKSISIGYSSKLKGLYDIVTTVDFSEILYYKRWEGRMEGLTGYLRFCHATDSTQQELKNMLLKALQDKKRFATRVSDIIIQ